MKKKIWDLYAPVYEMFMRADKKIYKQMYKRIPRVIEGKRVLEIATGPGLLAKHVASSAREMIATDYSEGMIKEAKKGDVPDNLRFEVADATDLPYEDNSFDVVIIANALHVMPEPDKAMDEIDRVLKKKGILIAPNFIHKGSGLKSRMWSRMLKLAGIKFEHQWTKEAYEE
ncbi:MAG: class I SAM-dependent methyltransferase, partial [Lachnospiraceae bacterium]|nr:class I SAM-dependent methyltransferase [Lachnospiraceae bacterium]